MKLLDILKLLGRRVTLVLAFVGVLAVTASARGEEAEGDRRPARANQEAEARERAERRNLRGDAGRRERVLEQRDRNQLRQLTPEMLHYLNTKMREEAERPRPLGQSIRLEFRITGGEAETSACSVWCSTDRFEISSHMGNDDAGREFEVEGRLRTTDAGILVEYSLEFEFRGQGGSLGAEAESAILTVPGKNVELMRVGNQTVVLLIQRQAKEF